MFLLLVVALYFVALYIVGRGFFYLLSLIIRGLAYGYRQLAEVYDSKVPPAIKKRTGAASAALRSNLAKIETGLQDSIESLARFLIGCLLVGVALLIIGALCKYVLGS
jgi:hypothetical protein